MGTGAVEFDAVAGFIFPVGFLLGVIIFEGVKFRFAAEMDAGVVNLSSRVKLLDIDENEEVEYKIVGSQEANPMQGRISDESPIGRGLLGLKVGETVTIDAPAGEIRFTILSVENA